MREWDSLKQRLYWLASDFADQVDWGSWGLWLLFLASLIVARLVWGTLEAVVNSLGETGARRQAFGVLPRILVVVVGLPLGVMLFKVLWELPTFWDWQEHVPKPERSNGIVIFVKAMAFEWMRAVAFFIPSLLAAWSGFTLGYLLFPDARRALNATDSPPTETVAMVGEDNGAGEASTAIAGPAYGLVPDVGDDEVLPEGWVYKPEPPGGHR